MAQKICSITGTSRSFGRVWAQGALKLGDKVAAHDHFGRLDVVVNNAGYGLFGAIEETSEAQARAQLETNLFGALWVTQAALPYLRTQGGGHIVQVSSMGGVLAFPTMGVYHATKWGLEAFSESLAQEVAAFGVQVTLVEPGGYATDWGGSSAVHSQPLLAYDATRASAAEFVGSYPQVSPRRPTRRSSPSSMPSDRRCGSSSAVRPSKSCASTTPSGSRPGRLGTTWLRLPRPPTART